MEQPIQSNQDSRVFSSSEKFEIDEHEFREITIDSNRIVAKGKSWETFEILITFIGAAWMEKWRRFGTKVLVVGIFLAGLPFFGSLIPGFAILLWGSASMLFTLPLMALGIVLVMIWALIKREALKIYTPAGAFKIEGTSIFVDAVWKAITNAQRLRDV
ncbi:MAG: hypothetical protein ACFFEV_06940 [Candidatus Thorarchaeota archaeon]